MPFLGLTPGRIFADLVQFVNANLIHVGKLPSKRCCKQAEDEHKFHKD